MSKSQHKQNQRAEAKANTKLLNVNTTIFILQHTGNCIEIAWKPKGSFVQAGVPNTQQNGEKNLIGQEPSNHLTGLNSLVTNH